MAAKTEAAVAALVNRAESAIGPTETLVQRVEDRVDPLADGVLKRMSGPAPKPFSTYQAPGDDLYQDRYVPKPPKPFSTYQAPGDDLYQDRYLPKPAAPAGVFGTVANFFGFGGAEPPRVRLTVR